VLIDGRARLVTKPAFGGVDIERLVARAVTSADEPRFSRRGVLDTALYGLAAVTVLPAVGAVLAACGSGRASGGGTTAKNEVHLDGAWLCNQRYALCTTAACQPSTTDPTVSVCRCHVLDGYSMGYTSCAQRAPFGTRIVSAFSTQNGTSDFAIMSCPADAPWANCLDVTCRVDPTNPEQAICLCPIVNQGPSFTFGGDCKTSTCKEVVWSGAAPPGVTQYTAAMKEVGRRAHFPKNCPST
jgi:hypothetical protein